MATMTEVLPERKGSRRSALRWQPSADEFGPAAGLLTIETDRSTTAYRVEEFPTGWAGRGFRLVKVTTGTDAEAESYTVFCSQHGPEADSCECRGCLRWSVCKHKDAVRALVGNLWL